MNNNDKTVAKSIEAYAKIHLAGILLGEVNESGLLGPDIKLDISHRVTSSSVTTSNIRDIFCGAELPFGAFVESVGAKLAGAWMDDILDEQSRETTQGEQWVTPAPGPSLDSLAAELKRLREQMESGMVPPMPKEQVEEPKQEMQVEEPKSPTSTHILMKIYRQNEVFHREMMQALKAASDKEEREERNYVDPRLY